MTIFVPTTKNFQSIHQNPCNRIEITANNNSATTTTMEGIVTIIPEKTFIDSTGTETLTKNHNKQENGNNQNGKGHQSNLGDASDNQEKNILAESLVETTILITNVIWCNFPLLPNVQVIPLRLYIQETLKRSRTSLSTLQTALLYLLRIKSKIGSIYLNLSSTSNSNLNSSSNSSSNSNPNIINIDSATCGRRMFLASLIVASKYLQDNNYSNNAWSKISGLSLKEINSIERRFLQLIVYNLYVSEEVFNNWTNLLNSHIKTILNNNDSPNDNNNNNNNNNNKGNNDNNSNIDNKSNYSNYSNDSNVNNINNNNNTGNRGNQTVDNHKRNFFMINSSTTTISSKECEVKG